MYTDENYLWGLVAYGLGFLLILPMLLWATRFVIPWRGVRTVVRLFFVALLITPVRAYTDMHYLAPAWLVAGFEFFQPTSPEGPARSIVPILVVFAGLLLVALVWHLVRRKPRGRRGSGRGERAPETGSGV